MAGANSKLNRREGGGRIKLPGKVLTANKIGIATSESYYDALSGVTLCGRNKTPMLLVSDGGIDTVCDFVSSRKSAIDHGYIFGGAAVVSASACDALEKAML